MSDTIPLHVLRDEQEQAESAQRAASFEISALRARAEQAERQLAEARQAAIDALEDDAPESVAETVKLLAKLLDDRCAKLVEAQARITALEEAATLAYRWLYDPLYTTEQFEDIAEWFYRETGYLRPGKDDVRGIHTHVERALKFREWCKTTGILVREGLKAALAVQPPKEASCPACQGTGTSSRTLAGEPDDCKTCRGTGKAVGDA